MDQKGAADTARAQDAESHFATLVKFDIVDSTQTSRKLSRPDHLELVRGFRAAVEGVLKPHNVKIEWDGDGALVVFGYPEVRVDASEAAVRAALRLLDAVRSVKAVAGVRLELRVGIASGVVSVDSMSGALAGLSINKAERLRAEAKPGQVLLAEDTRRLVKRFFEYEDLGIVRLKDFGETHVWRVTGESSVVSRFAAQRLSEPSTDIVGRDDVLARLSDAWAQAVAGHGSALCLVGDAGIGKSRLARTVLERAERDGALVLEIDCTPSSGNSPLLPIGVLLRRTAGIGPSASDSEKEQAGRQLLARLLGEAEAGEAWNYLAPLFGIESAPIPLDKTREQVRATTIATIVSLVRASAVQRPLALLCEDLHWADDTTAQVAHSLATVIGELPAVMITTRWPKAVTPIDLESVTSPFVTIPIDPLSASNAADLIRAVAGTSLSAGRVDAIVNRCGGVPLLLEEVTRSMLEHSDDEAAIRPSQSADSMVPPELQLVVESRLERLPQLKGIIEAASVLGREFPVPVLEAMVPGRHAEIHDALSTFADHGLFAQPEAAEGDRARFRHGLIRDAVYETLVSKDYLRRLHSRAADTLMAGYLGTPDASPDVLAQHLRIAARIDEAIRIRLAAGEDTFKRGAYVEAMGHCDAVRALVDETDDPARVRLDAIQACVLRGKVASGIHGYSAEPVEEAYREASTLFDLQTAADLRYPVIRGLATAALVRGDLANAHQHSVDGLALAGDAGRPDYRIDAMSVLAYTTLYYGRLEDCLEWIRRCLALYDAEGGENFRYPVPQDAKTAALALLPTAAWVSGDAIGAEAAIEQGLKHVDRLGRDFDKALLHAWTAGTRYTQRRYLEALNHAGIAYALGKEHKFQEWEGVGAMMALLSQSALAAAPEAVAQAVATAQAFKAKGIGLNGSYFLWGIARGLVTAGRPADADAMLEAALAVAAASQETRMNPEIWILKAEIERDETAAQRLLFDAYRLAESQGAAANALRAAAMIILRSSGEASARDRARATLDILDGRAPAPTQARWMHDDLQHARAVVNKLAAAPQIAEG